MWDTRSGRGLLSSPLLPDVLSYLLLSSLHFLYSPHPLTLFLFSFPFVMSSLSFVFSSPHSPLLLYFLTLTATLLSVCSPVLSFFLSFSVPLFFVHLILLTLPSLPISVVHSLPRSASSLPLSPRFFFTSLIFLEERESAYSTLSTLVPFQERMSWRLSLSYDDV